MYFNVNKNLSVEMDFLNLVYFKVECNNNSFNNLSNISGPN